MVQLLWETGAFSKAKHRIRIQPSNPTARQLRERSKNKYSNKNLTLDVSRNIINNG